MNTAQLDEVALYLERVRATLTDLPAGAREELLEDLQDHLAEVLAEGSGSLEQRLGPPEAYADELRAAAGLGAAAATRRGMDTVVQRVRSGLRRIDSTLGPMFGYGRISELLRLLRPGWWVLRGYLAGILIVNAVYGGGRWLPAYDSPTWTWFIIVGVCLVASVRLGRVTPRLPDVARYGVHLAALLLLFLVLVSLDLGERMLDQSPLTASYVVVDPYSQVGDIYPYDQNGNPLTGIVLYDQNGERITIAAIRCGARSASREASTRVGRSRPGRARKFSIRGAVAIRCAPPVVAGRPFRRPQPRRLRPGRRRSRPRPRPRCRPRPRRRRPASADCGGGLRPEALRFSPQGCPSGRDL